MRERLSPKLGQWLPVVVVAVTAVVLAATSISEVFIARAISATEAAGWTSRSRIGRSLLDSRPWDNDLTQREARAYTAAVQRGSFLLLHVSRRLCGPMSSSSHRHLR